MSERGSRIALIGLGNMGGPIGSRWIDDGRTVVGFDLSERAIDDFTARGGHVAGSAAEAADGASDVILLLPDSNVVDIVVRDLLNADVLHSDTVVVDMSSSAPERTQANGALLSEAGVPFLDAPVSGGVAGARGGTLTVMVGGDAVIVGAERQLLERLGRVVHVGAVGAGHAVKALNNLLSAVHLWATSEAVFVGERFGVEPATLLEVVNGSSGRSGSSEAKWPKFVLTESYDSGFSARLMLKDARIATDLATSLGLPTALGEVLVQEWARATESLEPSADHTEIARWLGVRAHARSTSHA